MLFLSLLGLDGGIDRAKAPRMLALLLKAVLSSDYLSFISMPSPASMPGSLTCAPKAAGGCP